MGKHKRGFWLATGVIAGVLLTNAAKKIKEDFEKNVDEDAEDKDMGEKAKEWFTEKKKDFKGLLDEKQEQINKIKAKLKADVIKEIDEEKRKELVKKATEKIAKLKEEIKEIGTQRRDEFLGYMKKINASGIVETASDIGKNVKKIAKEKLASKEESIIDDDFDFEDFEDEE